MFHKDQIAIKCLTFILIFFIDRAKGQIYSGRTFYTFCDKNPYKGLPYYPCHDWNPDKQVCQKKDSSGNDITRFQDCVDCSKRDAEKPYPRDLPRCPKECGPGEKWCDKKEVCLPENDTCDCQNSDVYCTYFSNHQQIEKYRCLSKKNHRRLVEKGTFQVCSDRSCKANCGEIGILKERTAIVNDNVTIINTVINTTNIDNFINGTNLSKIFDKENPNGTSNPMIYGFIIIGLAGLLSLSTIIIIIFICVDRKKKRAEIVWQDDNPEYGEVDYPGGGVTVIEDHNDYYGEAGDEGEAFMLDINPDYDRNGISTAVTAITDYNEDYDSVTCEAVEYDNLDSDGNEDDRDSSDGNVEDRASSVTCEAVEYDNMDSDGNEEDRDSSDGNVEDRASSEDDKDSKDSFYDSDVSLTEKHRREGEETSNKS